MYQNILLPIDGSQNSMNAVDQALELVKNKPGARITVLHVLPPTYTFAEAGIVAASINVDDIDEKAKQHGYDLVNHVGQKLKAAGIVSLLHIKRGVPAKVICEYVDNGPYDLVVMGSRGLGGFSEFVLGSVSHKVLSHVRKPVLVVR